MNQTWLLPLQQALERLDRSVTFFYRDDDAGWDTPALLRLLDLFDDLQLPIDLAVIPKAITPELAAILNTRLVQCHNLIGLHQHGYAHVNHQTVGRKCEFGEMRQFDQQLHDIVAGKEILHDYFGNRIDPIFTPPWNRCSQTTLDVLNTLPFTVLSRAEKATPFSLNQMVEISIHIDWLKRTHGERWSREQVIRLIAEKILMNSSIGIMLHHQEMDQEDLIAFKQFARLIERHPNIRHKRMRDLTDQIESAMR
ncbi:MAG TPA: hypothetical protein PKZ49_03305 [Nitrosomonas sp.]|nr:hypothetical protein [Nitrosomonas sp.]